MQFKKKTHVYDANERDLGHIDRIVMDPVTNEVTHVIVRQGLIFTEDKVIPIDYFRSATPERALLRDNIGDLDALPVFEETHYVPAEYVDEAERASDIAVDGIPGIFWYPPMGMSGHQTIGYYGPFETDNVQERMPRSRRFVKWTAQNIPDGTVALKEGAEVISADDEHVGNIEQIHIDVASNDATHMLISQGLFLKEKKWVPSWWVRHVEEDKVYLSVTARSLETLPEVEAA